MRCQIKFIIKFIRRYKDNYDVVIEKGTTDRRGNARPGASLGCGGRRGRRPRAWWRSLCALAAHPARWPPHYSWPRSWWMPSPSWLMPPPSASPSLPLLQPQIQARARAGGDGGDCHRHRHARCGAIITMLALVLSCLFVLMEMTGHSLLLFGLNLATRQGCLNQAKVYIPCLVAYFDWTPILFQWYVVWSMAMRTYTQNACMCSKDFGVHAWYMNNMQKSL